MLNEAKNFPFVKHMFDMKSSQDIELTDIRKLIANGTEESLHLDYEQIPSNNVKYDGLAQHISGFLNSSGGVIIFGVSEKEKRFPHKITWSSISKETLENNLYSRIDPWHEQIQILPIRNPSDDTKRIFVILVPKSETPPHMANHRYHIRLNFQTKPLGHDQISDIFKQFHLQKYDLINTVYGPIINELTRFTDQNRIRKMKIQEYLKVKAEKFFLLSQDPDFYLEINPFYDRVEQFNKALVLIPFRLAKIINTAALKFFKKKPLSKNRNTSSVSIKVRAESTVQTFDIVQAVLHNEDPIEFWKDDYPFDEISEVEINFCFQENTSSIGNRQVSKSEFKSFATQLEIAVSKDYLVGFIREEFHNLKTEIEKLLDLLNSRM